MHAGGMAVQGTLRWWLGHDELVKMAGWARTDGARAWCDGEPALVRCRGGPAEVASGALIRTRCWAEVAAKCAGLAQEEFERRRPGIYKRTPRFAHKEELGDWAWHLKPIGGAC
ncbi:hypothetical protein Taro_035222 [Colocasia esculenta]|uniref:Uncharacterized protein n=1 Tax=Colocasia esculenta TaxID=4460 RepID=A0A843WCJ7_COLES|nr:hypothetical protein [Colocasia esculenta]